MQASTPTDTCLWEAGEDGLCRCAKLRASAPAWERRPRPVARRPGANLRKGAGGPSTDVAQYITSQRISDTEWWRLTPERRARRTGAAAGLRGLDLNFYAVMNGEARRDGRGMRTGVPRLASLAGYTAKSVRESMRRLEEDYCAYCTQRSLGGIRPDGPHPTSTYRVYVHPSAVNEGDLGPSKTERRIALGDGRAVTYEPPELRGDRSTNRRQGRTLRSASAKESRANATFGR